MTAPVAITDNVTWIEAQPLISVLTPFFKGDPTPLMAALDREAGRLNGQVEIVTLDDGTGDPGLADRVAEATHNLSLPARFLSLRDNQGRSMGRNRLAQQARGRWLLFLDSDMLPDSADFLQTYLDLIAAEAPAVAVGGFSLNQTPITKAHALHRTMALKSDCVPVEQRRAAPEKHVFTSNLLVRRDLFETERFDEGFSGWGWEDVEWAMRVSRRHSIVHIDNTATHLGLDTAPAMAAKYEQAAANFARVAAAHFDILSTYPSYQMARLLGRVPLRAVWRPVLKAIALIEGAPLGLRDLAMRLYRAALYAEAV